MIFSHYFRKSVWYTKKILVNIVISQIISIITSVSLLQWWSLRAFLWLKFHKWYQSLLQVCHFYSDAVYELLDHREGRVFEFEKCLLVPSVARNSQSSAPEISANTALTKKEKMKILKQSMSKMVSWLERSGLVQTIDEGRNLHFGSEYCTIVCDIITQIQSFSKTFNLK